MRWPHIRIGINELRLKGKRQGGQGYQDEQVRDFRSPYNMHNCADTGGKISLWTLWVIRARGNSPHDDSDLIPHTLRVYTRAAVGMGIPMGIPMGMGMVWVWGLWWIPMGSVGNLWGFLNGCNFCGIETNSTNSELVFFITFIFPALSLLSTCIVK